MRRHLTVLAVGLLLSSGCSEGTSEEPEGGMAGVVEVDVSSRNHVLGEVDYPISPPAGGDHFFFWQNCGFYEAPLIDEVAVHSLEHGAVWVTYLPGTDPAVLSEISLAAVEESHLLASPYESQDSPLVLTAWGRQLRVEEWTDPAVGEFLDQYLGRSSPTAPEAGASCEGSIGNPPAEPSANYDAAVEAVQAEG